MVTPNRWNEAEAMPRQVGVQRRTIVLTSQQSFTGNFTRNMTSSLLPFHDYIEENHPYEESNHAFYCFNLYDDVSNAGLSCMFDAEELYDQRIY